MTDKEYIAELEKVIIFLSDCYTKGADSLDCHTDAQGKVDDKWLGIFMSFPTIQGMANRNYVRRIGNLRTKQLNREAVGLTFQELFERIKAGRRESEK